MPGRVRTNAWTENNRFINPGNALCLRLAADAVANIDAQRACDGMTYACKLMILGGVDINNNGR